MVHERVVASTGDLADGDMRQVHAGNTRILLVRAEGKFYALGPRCPHYGALLARGTLHGHRIRCPWHQACFDAVTGQVEEPPALDALARFPVRVEGENVLVELPDDPKMERTVPMCRANAAKDSRVFAIIGAGAAGNACAEALRQDGFEGRVVMITSEYYRPYDRPSLSKSYLASGNPGSPPFLRTEGFCRDYDIELLTGREVTSVDPARKQLTLADGMQLAWDKLLVASGSIPRPLPVPGSELDNIFTLRNLADAEKIRFAAEWASRIVLVGASFIAMEAACTFSRSGLAPTAVALESVPFEHSFGREIGAMYRRIHEEHGVSFRLNAKVSRFEGDMRVEEVVLEDGQRIPADLVVLGVGVRPATGFLQGIELNADGSVSVDEHFQVIDDVYAAGDIARFVDWRTGEATRMEHWRLAQQQGRIAAHNMAGTPAIFESVPFFWTTQFGLHIRYLGHTDGWDKIIFHGDPKDQSFMAFYVQGEEIAAVAGCHNDAKMAATAELIRAGHMPRVGTLEKAATRVVDKHERGSA